MPSNLYAPTRDDRFAFALWCLQHPRPELPVLEAIKGLAQRNCHGFEFHDTDLVPPGASAAARDAVLKDVKKLMADTGITATMAATNLFYHPVFRDGAFTSSDPAVRLLATQKVMYGLELAAELQARVFVLWGGREPWVVQVDAGKDPVEAARWFREAVNFLCEHVLSQGYDVQFSIEPKPAEPRGGLFLPTVGSVLGFIATLDHPDMVGVNSSHEFAQALDAGKLLAVHLNGEKPPRKGCDLKEAFYTTKLLVDHDYQGTVGFAGKPYRAEADPWDFVDRSMRTYKILEEKVRQFRENREIQDLLKEIHGANVELKGMTVRYYREAASKLKSMTFDADALARRKLPYERLDQLVTELLLGVL